MIRELDLQSTDLVSGGLSLARPRFEAVEGQSDPDFTVFRRVPEIDFHAPPLRGLRFDDLLTVTY